MKADGWTDRQTHMQQEDVNCNFLTILQERIKFSSSVGNQNEENFYTLTSLTK